MFSFNHQSDIYYHAFDSYLCEIRFDLLIVISIHKQDNHNDGDHLW